MIKLTIESFAGEENRHDLTHWHNKIEIVRVIKGTMHCVANGRDYTLNENDICIINRQQLHMIYCSEDNCTFQRLLVDPVLFTSYQELYQEYLVPLLTDQTFSHVFIGKKHAADLLRLMDRMLEVKTFAYAGYKLELTAMVYLLFQRIFIIYQSKKGNSNVHASTDIILFRRMADFIYENYHEKISLEDIANSGGVSKSKCGSVFKEYSGHTPMDYLNLYRLKMSTNLLNTTSKNIAEIAASCGFGQQSYYNRLFLREYGMTPKAFRKNMT